MVSSHNHSGWSNSNHNNSHSPEPGPPYPISSTPIPVPIPGSISSKPPRSSVQNPGVQLNMPPPPMPPQSVVPPGFFQTGMPPPLGGSDAVGSGKKRPGEEKAKKMTGKKKRKMEEAKKGKGVAMAGGGMHTTMSMPMQMMEAGGMMPMGVGVPMSMGIVVQSQVSALSEAALDSAGPNAAGMKWSDLSVADREYWLSFQQLMGSYNLNPGNPADYAVAKAYINMSFGF